MHQNIIDIESLDMEGRGVGHLLNGDGTQGKVIFVEGALPGERVGFASFRKKPKWEAATMTELHRESSMRVDAKCIYFGHCGGCAMQHLEPSAQVAMKQRVLEDNLKHIGKLMPERMMRPIFGPTWGYRYRARFSSRYVHKRGGALVGFRERHHTFVADMPACEVLPARISVLWLPLRALVNGLSIRERVPQIELAIGEDVDVLVFRILQPLSAEDESLLRAFSDRHHVAVYLQPGGPHTVTLLHPSDAPRLRYRLPDFDLEFPFEPTDFTQVNPETNRVLVRRAITLLEPRAGERVGDMFCGLGNFSLAIARRGSDVLGVEGNGALVRRAADNAVHNALAGRCEFRTMNLFEVDEAGWRSFGPFDRLLIDPPRDGAMALVKALSADPPARVVYVSCNPATLARDAGVMVHANGYRLSAAGIVNMFPHTSHVESIAVFDRVRRAGTKKGRPKGPPRFCCDRLRYSRLPAKASSRFSRCTNML